MVDRPKTPKYIFVLGGVMSGVGKGITTASIGKILQARGYNISAIKADPYLNVDAGTMNPTEHGEVFVLDSGLECDQDMGNYERFLNKTLPPVNYMTNGMIFKYVIDKERALGYGGKCVEPTYHITEEILRRIDESVQETGADITLFEIGGTIGEYQNAIFLEAARLLKLKHPGDVMFVMVSYLPVPPSIGEMKTKPTQNAVRQMNSYGVSPDIIIARSELRIDDKRKEKIAQMCGLPHENVISAPDVKTIYDVPINFERDGLSSRILSFFGLEESPSQMEDWEKFVYHVKDGTQNVKIGIVGKYFNTGEFILSDAYVSVIEALKISAANLGLHLELEWLSSTDYEQDPEKIKELSDYDGILVPGGFGKTGIEGKIEAIKFVRENKIPYFGLCYGMQLMTIEYARNVAGLKDANTLEIDKNTPHPVIAVMEEQKEKLASENMGGTMRLGAYPCVLKEDSLAYQAYSNINQIGRRASDTRNEEISEENVPTSTVTEKERSHDEVDGSLFTIWERHRHRYEVNSDYVKKLEKAGLVFSGTSPDGGLMEIAELPQNIHPFMLGTQFHPEFLARPLDPHPLFSAFLKAASKTRSS